MKLIATTNTIELVDEQDIIYIEACQNYSKFYMKDQKLILSRDSLGHINDTIQEDFFRIHHSYIINFNHVTRYFRIGEVIMSNGKVLPVARRRRTNFIGQLEKAFGSKASAQK